MPNYGSVNLTKLQSALENNFKKQVLEDFEKKLAEKKKQNGGWLGETWSNVERANETMTLLIEQIQVTICKSDIKHTI